MNSSIISSSNNIMIKLYLETLRVLVRTDINSNKRPHRICWDYFNAKGHLLEKSHFHSSGISFLVFRNDKISLENPTAYEKILFSLRFCTFQKIPELKNFLIALLKCTTLIKQTDYHNGMTLKHKKFILHWQCSRMLF